MALLDGTTGSAYYNGSDLGGYQFTSLSDVINQFILAYVGEERIITKVKRPEVAFHAQRGLQEFSFDILKSEKAYEIVVPPQLTMPLPQDYVNYVKICYSDSKGIKHPIYPTKDTSNPSNIAQTATPGTAPYYEFTDNELVLTTDSDTLTNYQSNSPSENAIDDYDYDDEIYDANVGKRYGLDPVRANVNGTYYIDEKKGLIHFSANLSGSTIVLEYISDSLGTEEEMRVHKFAEEALYKYIAYAIVSTRSQVPQNIVMRLRREAFATKRTAKLRLSNLKIHELIQSFRGKSKHIKH